MNKTRLLEAIENAPTHDLAEIFKAVVQQIYTAGHFTQALEELDEDVREELIAHCEDFTP